MRKNFMIILIALLAVLIVAGVGAYTLLMPQYKTIDVNGYKMEVPASDLNVTSVNDNYKTYDDNEHNITIKSYAINNPNETNYTQAIEINERIKSNASQNITHENITLQNTSGKYSYYDVNTYQMIEITSTDLDTLTHIVKSINKTEVTPNAENLTVNLTTVNNTTDTADTVTTTAKTTSKKKSSSTKKDSSETIYIEGNPEANGEYKGVGEGIYRNTRTGKVYVEHGRGNLVRTPELDHSSGLAE
ncbi:MAG: hypothetical protein Q4Q22_09235 [Methanosphaera sp.]|nr:hypothetical protein [Methanosphaera sp.]